MSSVIKVPCSFSLKDGLGNEVKGEAEVELENEKLVVLPKLGETIYLSLLDILDVASEDYGLRLNLSSRDSLTISDLGFKYDDFARNLSEARNEMILKYLLMNEAIRKSAVSGDLTVIDSGGSEKRHENCRLRLYESSLVFIPAFADPIRVHISQIANSEAKDYVLAITTEKGTRFSFSKMGKEFEATVRELSRAMNDLSIQTQSLIKELDPMADPSVIRNIARIMKDGRAARRSDIQSISTEVWSALEKKIEQTTMCDAYRYLKSISQQDRVAVGIKRGLMGKLTGNYLWVLVPIYGESRGNAIAVESVRITPENPESNSVNGENDPDETGGQATYFFRMVGRKDYPGSSPNDLDSSAVAIMGRISQLMLDINFRREPIFLTDQQLTEPRNARYRYAVNKISSLKELRRLFIGRVIHSNFEQWKSDVSDLLEFNVLIKDDDAKRKKSPTPSSQ